MHEFFLLKLFLFFNICFQKGLMLNMVMKLVLVSINDFYTRP